MQKFLLAHLCIALTALATASTAQGATPSFLCSKAGSWVEKTICAKQHLSAQDLELAAVHARMLRNPDPARRQQLQREQQHWWAARARCQAAPEPVDCLSDMYDARIADLRRHRDYPGDTPASAPTLVQEFSVKSAGPGWTRHLSEYARAIHRCRKETTTMVTGVLTAWPEEQADAVGMLLRTHDEQHLRCVADRRGERLISLQAHEGPLPVADPTLDLRTSPPPARCKPVPVMDATNRAFGWIVAPGC